MGIWLLTIQCPGLKTGTPTVSGLRWLWSVFLNIFDFYFTLILKRTLGAAVRQAEIQFIQFSKVLFLLHRLKQTSAPSTDFAEETSSQSISMAAEWINH